MPTGYNRKFFVAPQMFGGMRSEFLQDYDRVGKIVVILRFGERLSAVDECKNDINIVIFQWFRVPPTFNGF